MANLADTQRDVVNTVTTMQAAFEQVLREEFPNCNIVFLEELSFEKGLAVFRQGNSYDGNSETTFPMIIYTREPLRYQEMGIGKRLRNKTGRLIVNDRAVLYNAVAGELIFNFMYVHSDIRLIEQFEVAYHTEDCLSNIKELIVDIKDIGDFKYFLDAEPISSVELNHEGVDYKSIVGSIKVRGNYFTFKGESGFISNISASIYASRVMNEKTELIGTINI